MSRAQNRRIDHSQGIVEAVSGHLSGAECSHKQASSDITVQVPPRDSARKRSWGRVFT